MAFTIALLAAVFWTTVTHAADRLELVAGGGTEPPPCLATKARLDGPFGVDFDSQGNLFLVEISGHRVLRVDPQGQLTLIGGTGEKGNGGDDGPALKAQFNAMHSLAIGQDDAIYIADTLNNRVRRIDPKTGVITAFAGTGTKGDTPDGGPALQADFGAIYCVAFDPSRENLYLTDLDDRKIRKVSLKTGIATTVAGNGQKGVPTDGVDAKTSPLIDPRAATIDARGNLYVLERSGHALRVVDPQGKIRTVAGTGQAGPSGDGSDALKATLNGPKHLCIDRDGTVLIADTENHVVRRYNPQTGRISPVAGTGKKGTAGVGGDPLSAELFQPHGVWIGPQGQLYITDSGNHRVLKITPEAVATAVSQPPVPQGRRSAARDPETGASLAVVVPDGSLIQSAQFLSLREGRIEGTGDLAAQWSSVWKQIEDLATEQEATPVRVHVYAADAESAESLRPLLKASLERSQPALTVVVGKLPHPEALVAADAVLAANRATTRVSLAGTDPELKCAAFSVMPPGARLYISGQAEKGDLPTATRSTLESLERTLQSHGLDRKAATQVKAFLTPMAEAKVVRDEIEKFFGAGQVPPVVLVEWSSTLPIEIELVAWAGPQRPGEVVEYLSAPGLSPSPIFSRAARINRGPTILISGLTAVKGEGGEAEVTEVFATLGELLKETGSDLKHLVKATYYVSTNDASQKLNELRPKYYDPQRPPAASKAQVAGTARANRGLTLDMIAVPSR